MLNPSPPQLLRGSHSPYRFHDAGDTRQAEATRTGWRYRDNAKETKRQQRTEMRAAKARFTLDCWVPGRLAVRQYCQGGRGLPPRPKGNSLQLIVREKSKAYR